MTVASKIVKDAGVPAEITLGWLWRRRACGGSRRKFMELFGRKAPLTRDNLRAAAAAGLPISWLASRLLDGAGQSAYNHRNRAAHVRDTRARDTAYEAFRKAAAGSPYSSQPYQAAHEIYLAAHIELRAAYGKALADALADALGLP